MKGRKPSFLGSGSALEDHPSLRVLLLPSESTAPAVSPTWGQTCEPGGSQSPKVALLLTESPQLLLYGQVSKPRPWNHPVPGDGSSCDSSLCTERPSLTLVVLSAPSCILLPSHLHMRRLRNQLMARGHCQPVLEPDLGLPMAALLGLLAFISRRGCCWLRYTLWVTVSFQRHVPAWLL